MSRGAKYGGQTVSEWRDGACAEQTEAGRAKIKAEGVPVERACRTDRRGRGESTN